MSAAALSPLGLNMDEFDFSELETKPDMSEGKKFELSLDGISTPEHVTKRKKSKHKSLIVELYGSTEGWFNGGFKGTLIALEKLADLDVPSSTVGPISLDGQMKLVRPEYAVQETSEYLIILRGEVTQCCGEGNFKAEINFKSVEATGEFEGTTIKGTFNSPTDLGFPLDGKIKGVQLESQDD
jgi:hypothetical protein